MDNQALIFYTTSAPVLCSNPTIIQHGNTTPVSNMNDDVAKDITRIQTESLLVPCSFFLTSISVYRYH